MSTPDELFQLYEGRIVPRSFNAGFVTLSYIVSLIGAASTLELINRRTSRNGLYNHLILLSTAVTMGGIAIWCMVSVHFIGNRAINLANGEAELQISYSSGFTALSFFLPIVVLLGAFVMAGTNNKVAWWRIICGGTTSGAAICGMHYLGNASINNYRCEYEFANVIGAALIAVAANIIALALFFQFRASWTNSWWKRLASAVVMACAVSGMHWCASTGTQYRLVRLTTTNQVSRSTTVIVVIFLSAGAALVMAGTAIYTTQRMRRYALKAKKIVLAAAVFDKTGRILVNPDGLLPSETITNTYIEKTHSDIFSIAHPLFHWMFQASRNWLGISDIIPGMKNHLTNLPRSCDANVALIDDNGQPIENYDVIFRELFCLAAGSLADRMKEDITNVGILWDEILPTGKSSRSPSHLEMDDVEKSVDQHTSPTFPTSPTSLNPRKVSEDCAEKGEIMRVRELEDYGFGSLMFLVRRLENTRDMDKLEAAGFRFADVRQVCNIIGSGMQIKTHALDAKLRNMATYADGDTMMEPGVHLGLFGVKARVAGFGFDILVRRGSRNLLPTMQMPFEHLEPWQMEFLQRLNRMSVPALCQTLDNMKYLSRREMLFASQLYGATEALRTWINNPIFDQAVLTCKVVQVPCRPHATSSSVKTCSLITLSVVIPIHLNVQNTRCEFVPLNLFRIHQSVDSSHAAFHARVHREITPIVNAAPLTVPKSSHDAGRRSPFIPSLITGFGQQGSRFGNARTAKALDADGNPIPTEFGIKSSAASNHTNSTFKFWGGTGGEGRSPKGEEMPDGSFARHTKSPSLGSSSFGGIMVSQEITVDVQEAQHVPDRIPSRPAVPKRRDTRKSQTLNLALEMDSFSEKREDIVGLSPGSTIVASEAVNPGVTFVDELFAACMNGI